MQKILAAKIATLLILVTFCCQPVNTQPGYGEQICPLSRYNIKVAEDLMKTVQELLEEVNSQGLDTSEVEGALAEAKELLEKARIFCLRSQNCIAGNFYAIKCLNQLKKIQEILESMLNTLRDEEYAVYRTLIDTGFDLIRYKYNRNEVQLIVIIDHTSGGKTDSDLNKTLEWAAEEMPAVEQETLDNFLVRNAESHPLENYFNLTVHVVLISDEEIYEIFQKGTGWKEFYEKYPFSQGTMILSRVGFNSEMNQGLVYLANEADDSIGSGYYVLLTKKNGVWTIQDWVSQWIY